MKHGGIYAFLLLVTLYRLGVSPLPAHSQVLQALPYKEEELQPILAEYTQYTSGAFCGNGPSPAMMFLRQKKVDPDRFLFALLSDPAYAEFWPTAWTYYWYSHRDRQADVAQKLIEFSNRTWPSYPPAIQQAIGICHSLIHQMLYDPDLFNKDPEIKNVLMIVYTRQVIDQKLYEIETWIRKYKIQEGLNLSKEETLGLLDRFDRSKSNLYEKLQPALLAADGCVDNLVLLYLLSGSDEIKKVLDQCRGSSAHRIQQSIEFMLSDVGREHWQKGEYLKSTEENYPTQMPAGF